MFRSIIVTVVLVSVFHLSIAGDPINFGDINSFITFAQSTTENEDESEDQDSAISALTDQMSTAEEWVQNLVEYSLVSFNMDLQISKQADSKFEKLDQYQSRINKLFIKFSSYLRAYRIKFYDSDIAEFLTACTSNDTDGLQETLRNIYLLVIPSNARNDSTIDQDSENITLFQYIQQILDGAPLEIQCNRGVSVYQRLYETYNAIVTTEAKGHIMSMFSYRMQKIKQNVTNEDEMKKAGANLVMRAEEYLLALKNTLPAASRTYRRCDPKEQRRGDTFIELEGLIQVYLTNEADTLGSNVSPCVDTCETVRIQNAQTCDSSRHWCVSRKCEGIIQNCFGLGKTKVCEANSDDIRRYQWFRGEDETYYGQQDDCATEVKETAAFDNYGSRYGRTYCDTCACICIEENCPSKALRTLSMRPRLSNIDENMVITGVRIAEYSRVVQIEILQAKLLPNGRINCTTEIWVENEQFEYTQEVYGGGFYLLKDGDEKELLNITDDYTFIWSKQKILNLDELYWEPNYVVTGIKFGFSDPEKVDEHNWNLSPIQLEIRVTEFDYDSGLLNTESDSSQWITAEKMKGRLKEYDYERMELSLVDLDVPVKSPINLPDSTPNQRITFGTSDYEKDAGQSTVPFFDAVPVTGLSVPLAGIGIFHKGATKYAGYISLRTYSIDLSDHINTQMTSDDADMYKADFSDPMPFDVEVEE